MIGDSKFYVESTSQSTLPQSSTCREEVVNLEQGVGGNNRPKLTAEVVPDSSPSDSEQMEVEMQQNEPSEQLHTQSQTVLHNDDLAANRKTGLCPIHFICQYYSVNGLDNSVLISAIVK